MIYTQEKERENRFLFALKLSFPFLIVSLVWIFRIVDDAEFGGDEIILFSILSFVYVYFNLFLIYKGFQNNMIDLESGAFLRGEILDKISKSLQSEDKENIVYLYIKNIDDIKERYGYEISSTILKEFVKSIYEFFESYKFKNIPIGTFDSGKFLFIIDCETPKLEHLLRVFGKKIIKEGISNIEIKTDFTTLPNSYNKDLTIFLNRLFHSKTSVAKIDILKDIDKIIYDCVENQRFDFRLQKIKALSQDKQDIYNLSFKLISNELGNLSKSKVREIINKTGNELNFEIKFLSAFARNVNFSALANKIITEVSPVILRNQEFRASIEEMIKEQNLEANKIVFAFSEDKAYEEMRRFEEILLDYKKLGFSFALDKFLGKNASFEYFKYLPVDYVIFDVNVNKNINDEKIFILLENIVKTCNQLDISTIIRFVENVEFLEKIKKINIKYAQGFYIAKPYKI